MNDMTLHDDVVTTCPKCRHALPPNAAGPDVTCLDCGWHGRVLHLPPLRIQAHDVETAVEDDAACAHHPDKRAVAVCTGTGDFICSLCLVELQGKSYSLQYLEAGGKALAGQAFERHLPRPDRVVYYYFLLYFIPWIGMLWAMGTPVWLIMSHVKLAEARRLRQSDPLYRSVVSSGRITAMYVLAWLPTLMFVGVTALIVAAR